MIAKVVPSNVAAASAMERGGMAKGVVGFVGFVVGRLRGVLGENGRWLWWWKRRGEEREAE